MNNKLKEEYKKLKESVTKQIQEHLDIAMYHLKQAKSLADKNKVSFYSDVVEATDCALVYYPDTDNVPEWEELTGEVYADYTRSGWVTSTMNCNG